MQLSCQQRGGSGAATVGHCSIEIMIHLQQGAPFTNISQMNKVIPLETR